jgi:uncharacterized protein involved in outer membrane biogenesis
MLAFNSVQLLMATVVSKKHTTIDCAIGKFNVSKGVATSDIFFLHTPKLIATGTGHVDFNDENVDIQVNTEAKGFLFKKKAVLRIHGPLKDLKIDTDLKNPAMVALMPLEFSMVGLSFLDGFITDGKKSPCIPTDKAAPSSRW